MGFLCKNSVDETIVSVSDINQQELKRDLGLSNVNNVNTTTNFCFEGFNGPTHTVSDTIKPSTGVTSGCTSGTTNCSFVYNLSEIDDFDLTFNLSGSTDYTGYTGSFCYKMFSRNSYILEDPLQLGGGSRLLNEVTPTKENCFPFSGITGNTIVENVSMSTFPISDNDIMLRTYYKFESKECNVGLEYNTWDNVSQFAQFDYDNDWYFITTVNPSKPELLKEPQDLLEESQIVQQEYLPDGVSTSISLNSTPVGGEVMMYVNGILLSSGTDYIVDYENYPRANPVVRLLRGSMNTNDVVKLVYMVSPQSLTTVLGTPSNDLFSIDQFQVTGFTSGTTASTVNVVNYNPSVTPQTQEIYLENDFNDSDNIVMFVNGVSLIEGVEFFRSRTSNNRLILNPNITDIRVGDIIVIWYFNPRSSFGGDLGSLDTDSVTINWAVNPIIQPNINSGRFIVEVKEDSDSWNTLYTTDTTEYINDVDSYSLTISNLDLTKRYNYRVVFEKTYLSQLNNDVITKSYSTVGSFDTMGDNLKFSY